MYGKIFSTDILLVAIELVSEYIASISGSTIAWMERGIVVIFFETYNAVPTKTTSTINVCKSVFVIGNGPILVMSSGAKAAIIYSLHFTGKPNQSQGENLF